MTLIAGLLFASTPGASTNDAPAIYRSANAQGITVFTDRPGPDHRAMDLPWVNTYSPVEPGQTTGAATRKDGAAMYQSLLITAPGDGETIRRNGGDVRVRGRVEPDLKDGHGAVLIMDGSAVPSHHGIEEPTGSRTEPRGGLDFALSGVARGPHTLRIAIMDGENNVLMTSAPVSFHLLRSAVGLRR